MTDLTIRSTTQYRGSSTAEITVELAKMLALVLPTSMTTDQQELWLRAAVDALEDITAREIEAVSAEVRRTVTRPPQIVPEIAKLVAARRAEAQRERETRARHEIDPPLAPQPPRKPQPPMTAAEIAKLPAWLRETGIRVGFLAFRDGKLVDVAA
jgi:nitrogen fixation/metabolism regulation signal transduction histidine kinase